MRTRKSLFTVLGSIQLAANVGKRFVPSSSGHLATQLAKLPDGKKVAVEFSEDTYTRSQAQLAYHWVLIGYLAEHCGYSKDEMHDAVVRMKFGTKTVSIGDHSVEVRRSVSDAAKMPTADMGELIEHDLALCAELGIVVPSMQELGYISNN